MKRPILRLKHGEEVLLVAGDPAAMALRLFELQNIQEDLILEVKIVFPKENSVFYEMSPSELLILVALATEDERFQIDPDQEFVPRELIDELKIKLRWGNPKVRPEV